MMLPKHIDPCPIIQAGIEIRFKPSEFTSNVILGMIYNILKSDYNIIKELDILQLPLDIRRNDPNLSYQPCYQLISDNFIFQLGDNVLSLVNPKKMKNI